MRRSLHAQGLVGMTGFLEGRWLGAAEWDVCFGRFWDGEPVPYEGDGAAPYGRYGGAVPLNGMFVPSAFGGSKKAPYDQHSAFIIQHSLSRFGGCG